MNYSPLLKSVLLVSFILISITGSAQFARTSYFLENSHFRQQLNPALIPNCGYINIPVLGSLNAGINSSSFNIQDVIDISENKDNDNYFMNLDFMNRLETENNYRLNLNTDIISAGWYKGKNFWSINVGMRNNLGSSIPKSMFQYMRNAYGLTGNDWKRLKNMDIQINNVSLELNSYVEAGVGYTRIINEHFTIGGKIKVLLGLGNLKMNIDNAHIKTNIQGLEYLGKENLTLTDLENIHGEMHIDIDAKMESSFRLLNITQENGYINKIELGTFGFSGYGAAVDLGISYQPFQKLNISASVLDLGGIIWLKKYTNIASANNKQHYNPQDETDRNAFVDRINNGNVFDLDFPQMKLDDTAKRNRKTGLAPCVVLSAEYELLEKWLILGSLYTAHFTHPKTFNELTFTANMRPSSTFNLAVSYSVIQTEGKSFGIGAKLGPVFIGSDYIFLGKNTTNINLYLGISIPLNN